jgi:hypothetical protein
MALYEQRRRLTAQLLCVMVVVFLGHFYIGCGQEAARDPLPGVSASDDFLLSHRHDPRTCPVYRALQSTWASQPTAIRAALPLRAAKRIGPTARVVVCSRIPRSTTARGPPLRST